MRLRAGTASRVGGAVAVGLVVAVGLAAFLWPFVVGAPGGAAHAADAPWVLVAVMPLLVAVMLAETTSGRLDAKALALLGVLAALGTALRIPTGGIAGLELVFFLLLPAGRVFGRSFGFVLGALTLLASAVVTAGVGPWLPFQMLAAAAVGYGAGLLPQAHGRTEVGMLAAYGIVASYAFGAAMDLWSWPFVAGGDTALSYVPGDGVTANLGRFWAYHLATGLGWDTMRALSTAALCLVLGRPVLAGLRRASRRAAFAQPAAASSTDRASEGRLVITPSTPQAAS